MGQHVIDNHLADRAETGKLEIGMQVKDSPQHSIDQFRSDRLCGSPVAH
jgi:hypothetical protein